MEWTYLKNGGVRIGHIDPFSCELIRQLPIASDPGTDARANERLFYSPTKEPEGAQDWKELIEPEIRSLFDSATDRVEKDLRRLGPEAQDASDEEDDEPEDDDEHRKSVKKFQLEIPADNLTAWISTLNRARLVLVEVHQFTEEELQKPFHISFENRRDLAMFQMNLYGLLLDFILDAVDSL